MRYSSGSHPLVAEKFDPLPIVPNREELMRYLGYKGPSLGQRTLPGTLEQLLRDSLVYLQPKGSYSIYRIEQWGPRVMAIGGVSIEGQVATFLEGADRIAVFVVTVGQGITEISRAASSSGDIVSSWALDALGSWAAEAAAQAIAMRLTRYLGDSEAISPRYSPGYCGMNLSVQQALFKLVEAESLGVCLLPSMLMQPLKSVSGLLGLGDRRSFGRVDAPCERCNDAHCSTRR